MIDHDEIMRMSQTLGRPAKTLIALSDMSDPFIADTPAKRQAAEWVAEIYERFGFGNGIHLRRIHYRLISQETPVLDWNGRPYENTLECWNAFARATVTARYLGLIPIEDFIDRRNPDAVIHLAETPDKSGVETAEACIDGFSRLRLSAEIDDFPELELSWTPVPTLTLPALGNLETTDTVQPYHIEIWCEKTTISDILDVIAWRHKLNIVYGKGELSLTSCRDLMSRIANNGGRPVRILYLSDFDPAGQSMPVAVARKLEWLIRREDSGIDLQLRPILLSHDQCIEYRLPRTPIKETDRRGARFEGRFGEGATELDALEALHPGELRRMVESEIGRYRDDTLQEQWEAIESETNDELALATEAVHADHADAIAPIVDEFDVLVAAADAFRQQAEDAIAALVAEYQSIAEAAQALHARAQAAIAPILTQYQTSIVECAAALRERAEPVFAAVADDLRERGEEILANMETIEADGDEDEDPLFDSSRDYIEQIDRYKEFQGKPTTAKKKGPKVIGEGWRERRRLLRKAKAAEREEDGKK